MPITIAEGSGMVGPADPHAAWPEPDRRILSLHRRAPTPLPLSVFGPFWGPWIEQAAEASGAPPDFVAGPLLAAASVLVGNARWAAAHNDWVEPPHLWVASVGESGGSKSPAADRVLRDLVPAVEREMQRGFADRAQEHHAVAVIEKAKHAAWKAKVHAAIRRGEEPPVPPVAASPDAPVPPMLRCDDATIEVVAQRLAFAAPKGLLMVRDELAGHLKGMNAYHPGARTFWLESFGGREFRVDRVKHPEPIRIRHCACAWWGGIQPDRLAEVMREADDGLLARFIYVWPEARRFELPSANPDVAVATAALLRLNALEMAEGPDGREPVIVRLDPAALPDLVALARYAQDAQAFTGPLMSSTLGKARGLALRISLVLTMLWWAAEGGTSAPPTTISREAFQAAALLVRDYIMPMAERVFVDAAAPMRDRNAATLARWIAKARPSEVHGRFL